MKSIGRQAATVADRTTLGVRRNGSNLLGLALFTGAWLAASFSIGLVLLRPLPVFGDRYVYWSNAGDPVYQADGFMKTGFLYTPAAAQALAPLGWLPFELFWAVFALAAMATTAWLVRPLGWRYGLPLWIIALPISLQGNIEFLFAIVVVLGFKLPGLWAIPLLTKISPGVGVLWFFVRREWRNAAIAVGTTGAIAAVSFLLAPGLWIEWLSMLWSNAQLHGAGSSVVPLPLLVRVAMAGLIVGWGAMTERRWTVLAGTMLARPDLWYSELTMLLALPRLESRRTAASLSPRPTTSTAT
jgi:hypothetical protein